MKDNTNNNNNNDRINSRSPSPSKDVEDVNDGIYNADDNKKITMTIRRRSPV
jgi:hypothetical protein